MCTMFSPLDNSDWLSISVYREGSICFSLRSFLATVYISTAKQRVKFYLMRVSQPKISFGQFGNWSVQTASDRPRGKHV